MKRFSLVSAVVIAGVVIAAGTSFGQRGGGGGGGDWIKMMLQRSVPIESVMTFLAFDQSVNLDDAGLANVRKALRPIVKKREDIVPADSREESMKIVEAMKQEMREVLKPVLNEAQNKALAAHMAELDERAERARRWGGRG